MILRRTEPNLWKIRKKNPATSRAFERDDLGRREKKQGGFIFGGGRRKSRGFGRWVHVAAGESPTRAGQ